MNKKFCYNWMNNEKINIEYLNYSLNDEKRSNRIISCYNNLYCYYYKLLIKEFRRKLF